MAYTTIDDPSVYFQTLLYTGDGNDNRNLVNTGNSDLQPDWIWNKRRDSTSNHFIFDSSRGTSKIIATDSDEAEGTNANQLQAFQTDGFQLGSDNGSNGSSRTMVAWQWKANGGTTTTNDASTTSVGTIDSVYQANTTAGFSIVTYTGTGSAGTVAHGIGTAPTVIFTKRRDAAEDWAILHLGQGNDRISRLNTTDASSDLVQSGAWNDTSPTSTVFSLGNGDSTNGSGRTQLAYCFAPIQGYSKFGSYTGNGNADGPFVYTGFKTKWLMTKRYNSAGSGTIFDNTLDDNTSGKQGNPNTQFVQANNTNAEATTGANFIDFLSNGFKCRGTDGGTNGNGDTYIYMAFAESPFVSSKGVPTTAR